MGGAQYQVKCLVETLLETKKYSIHFIAKTKSPQYIPRDYKFHEISKLPIVSFQAFFLDYFKLMKILKRINPDVIYETVGCAYTGIAAMYAKKHNIKMIWHIASDDDVTKKPVAIKLNIFDNKLLIYGINNATHIIAQTYEQINLLKSNYNIKNATLVRNFHPYPKEKITKEDPIKVVWIANFKPLKQPELFIQLANDLKYFENRVQFIMIGAASVNEKWQNKLENDINNTKNLAYLGSKSIHKVNEILAKSHIFINTSTVEGFANTYIQSWMREVPVISLHCDPDNLLSRHNIGYLAGSYDKMKELTLELITNASKRIHMGKNAKSYAFKQHSLKNTKSLMDIIDE